MKIILSLSLATEERLLGPLIAAGHEIVARPAGGAELAAALDSLRPDLALVSATSGILSSTVASRASEHGARLIAVAASSAQMAHATSIGVEEVVDDSVTWEALAARLTGRDPEGVAVRQPGGGRAPGAVIAVWGPTGAPGRTTTAITIASELAAEGRRVALIDADTHGSAIATSLGLFDEAPGFAAACRLAGSGGLDLAQLDRVSTRVPVDRGEMFVLTGITSPSRWPELSAQRVDETLRIARSWADAVIVDCGFSLESDEEIVSDFFAPRRNAATLSVLAAADRVIAVGAADPIGVARLIRGHSDLTTLVDADKVSVLINKVRRSTVGLGAAGQIRSALERFAGIEDPVLIPYDPAAHDAALLSASTLREAAPKSPARAAIGGFVQTVLVEGLTATARPAEPSVSRFAPQHG